MANLFEIAPINPIRMVRQVPGNDLYLIKPFDLREDDKCYYQKFQRNDITKLQILSDFPEFTFHIYNLEDNELALNVVPVAKSTNIIGQTFIAYELTIDFSLLAEGRYYAELTYLDETDSLILYQSEPLCVKDSHDDTLLIEYRNSENNFSIIFDTGISFAIRVEGTIKDFKPEFDDVIYNDQQRNPTKLDSIIYRSFKLYIGNAPGIPDWMADKINRALGCDEKMIEGVYYEKAEGAKWEIQREKEYEFIGLSIDIMPVDNGYLQRLQTTGDTNLGGFIPVQKIKNYFNNGGNITMSSIFRKYTLLEKICVINNDDTFVPFTMNVGTTSGGSQIGSFDITDRITTININNLFNAVASVYLSGLATGNNDVTVIYKQLDETPIPAGSTPNPYTSLGIGAVVIYDELEAGALNLDWNLVTGLGNSGTAWEDWAICDGRNGTKDYSGFFPVGYSNDDPDYGVDHLGLTGGLKEVQLTVAELPKHKPELKTSLSKRGTTGSDALYGNFNDGNSVLLEEIGNDEAHENRPPYIVSLFVKKIA